jgi:hypothetical protein
LVRVTSVTGKSVESAIEETAPLDIGARARTHRIRRNLLLKGRKGVVILHSRFAWKAVEDVCPSFETLVDSAGRDACPLFIILSMVNRGQKMASSK